MPTDLDHWFTQEILVHEPTLTHLLLRHWPLASDVSDLRQEIYVRVYEAAMRERPRAPRAFLLTTARHLMIDRLRRQKVVPIEPMGDFELSNVFLADELSPERWCDSRQALKHLIRHFDALPDRCREVVWLRRIEEWPQKEVARHLGISEKTVEKHLAKGMRLLAEGFYGHASASPQDGSTDKETPHVRQFAD